MKSIDAGLLETARRYPKGSEDANNKGGEFHAPHGAKRVQKRE